MNLVIRIAVSGKIQLPADALLVGRDPEMTTPMLVEQGRKDARRIEARTAKPVDCAMRADKRGRLQVADQPVVTDIGIPGHGILLPPAG
jgi:hypothetical protein